MREAQIVVWEGAWNGIGEMKNPANVGSVGVETVDDAVGESADARGAHVDGGESVDVRGAYVHDGENVDARKIQTVGEV